MTLDAQLKWGAIAALAAASVVGAAAEGLRWPPAELALVAAGAAPLAYLAWRSHRYGGERGAACWTAFLQFFLFTMAFTAFTCVVAGWDRPLVDDALRKFDARLGINVSEIDAWAARHPIMQGALALAYRAIVPQMLLVIWLLALWEGRPAVERFIRRLMMAALLTLALYTLWPALGPLANYPEAANEGQAHFFDLFRAYRNGAAQYIHPIVLEGMITFPSFHVAWAALLAASFVRWPRWLLLFGLLDAAVVLAVLTTGWHYAADALAGLLVAALAIILSRGVIALSSGPMPRAAKGERGASAP
jgi:hypothetical protein